MAKQKLEVRMRKLEVAIRSLGRAAADQRKAFGKWANGFDQFVEEINQASAEQASRITESLDKPVFYETRFAENEAELRALEKLGFVLHDLDSHSGEFFRETLFVMRRVGERPLTKKKCGKE